MKAPGPIEGAVLYLIAIYSFTFDVLCVGLVRRLLLVSFVGIFLIAYCAYRVWWCGGEALRKKAEDGRP